MLTGLVGLLWLFFKGQECVMCVQVYVPTQKGVGAFQSGAGSLELGLVVFELPARGLGGGTTPI